MGYGKNMKMNQKMEQYCQEVKLDTENIAMQLQGIYDRMLEDVLKSIDDTCKEVAYTNFDASYIGNLKMKIEKNLISTFGK
jgi:type IV secretory pathway TrbL component